jgi:hypothetical protein
LGTAWLANAAQIADLVTRTPLAQLLPVPATALVSGLSTMIITSHTIRVGADRGDLIAYRRLSRI